MKKITLALLIGLLTLSCYAQDRKDLVISIAAGKLTSPYYLENKAGRFYSIDFDYHLSRRSILSANFNGGKHNYYDNVLSTDPGYIKSDGTNSIAKYHTFSILYKYKFFNNKVIAASIGTGAGVMTHSKIYPYKINNGSIFNESTWTDLVFPVRLEIDCKLSNYIHLGLISGFYIQPDYPVLAYYAGPKLSYQLK